MKRTAFGNHHDLDLKGPTRLLDFRAILRLTMVWLLAVAAQPIVGQDIPIRRIADTTTIAPNTGGLTFGGSVPFRYFRVHEESVLFYARVADPADPDRMGLYLAQGQGLEVVVDENTIVPGTGLAFTYIDHFDMDGDTVAFSGGNNRFVDDGVYRVSGSDLEVIADSRTPIPDQGSLRFQSFGDVSIHQGRVAFAGGATRHGFSHHQDGIYLARGGVLVTIIDEATPIPGGSGNFDLVATIELDAYGLAFEVPRRSYSNLVAFFQVLGNGLELVADTSTTIPGQTGPFTTLRRFAYHEGQTVFIGDRGFGYSGAFISRKGELDIVADTTTTVPGTGRTFFRILGEVAFSGNHVVFKGLHLDPENRTGLYVASDGALRLIAEEGGPLGGDIINRLHMTPGSADHDRVVFSVSFQSGRQGLYEARIPFFADGFESGDTSAWTMTTP